MSDGGFCTDCGYWVETFEGLTCCPNCNSKGQPCPDSWQVAIRINWQELRILCIWAERWQREKLPETRTVFAIADRIQEQCPALAERMPLTLAGEMGQLAEWLKENQPQSSLEVTDPGLRRDTAEQTGHELGLIDL